MRSVGLWRWYIDITATILDTVHRPVFCYKHDVSETEFCLHLQVEHKQVGPVDRANSYVQNCDSYDIQTDGKPAEKKIVYDLRFSRRWLWRMPSSGMLHHVVLVRTDVSEERSSIIRVTRIGELGTTLAVSSNRRTLRRNTMWQSHPDGGGSTFLW
jgi:hypothetical protein